MEHPGFYDRAGPYTVREICEAISVRPGENVDLDLRIEDVKPVDHSGPGHVTFVDNPKYLKYLETTQASVCIVSKKYLRRAPETLGCLISAEPYRSFADVLALFYPGAQHPITRLEDARQEGRFIHPSANLEEGVIVEPGAVIGPECRIGRNTRICSGAVVGYRVYIGRDSFIGPNASILHGLLGNRVILHAGVRIGQDGFGFAMGLAGHTKVPQIGRVIIQDDVEIGANTTVDRGALMDTVIGEGTKIDNIVQIGHNVVIGRHCIIVAGTAISGSAILKDFVAMGGHVSVNGHITIGTGAQIATTSAIKDDVPAGGRYGGSPDKPVKEWFREMMILKQLAQKKSVDSGKLDDD